MNYLLNMGDHAPYVWSVVLISTIVLAVVGAWPWIRGRQLRQEIARKQRWQQKKSSETSL